MLHKAKETTPSEQLEKSKQLNWREIYNEYDH